MWRRSCTTKASPAHDKIGSKKHWALYQASGQNIMISVLLSSAWERERKWERKVRWGWCVEWRGSGHWWLVTGPQSVTNHHHANMVWAVRTVMSPAALLLCIALHAGTAVLSCDQRSGKHSLLFFLLLHVTVISLHSVGSRNPISHLVFIRC